MKLNSARQASAIPPFPAFPSVTRYVDNGPVAEAVGRVIRGLETREAISLIMGPPGTGKSLALSSIADQIADQIAGSPRVISIGNTTIETASQFNRQVLHRLGVKLDPSAGDDAAQIELADHINGSQAAEEPLVILIDEAQYLSVDALEAVRMVTNLTRDGVPAALAVLAGGPKLEEILVDPALESFNQRVATRCYLHPMNLDETRRYVRETIENCGSMADSAIGDDAIDSVHHATAGVPRLVNQIMTAAIDVAAEMDKSFIDGGVVDSAWAELQQLPSPMVEPPVIAGSSSSIEFGELSIEEVDETAEIEALVRNPERSAVATLAGIELDQESVIDEPVNLEFPNIEGPSLLAEEEFERAEESPRSADSNQLFGEFEQEEEIAIGVASAAASPAQPTKDSCQNAVSASDLESMLHQEIVQMGQLTSDMTLSVNSEAELSLEEAPGAVALDESVADSGRPVDAGPAETAGEDVDCLDESVAIDLTGDPVIKPLRHDQPQPIEFGSGQRDDQDLLIIEDEVAIDGESAQESPVRPPVSVDFQAMMTRMRTGV